MQIRASAMDQWDAVQCLEFLEAEGEAAPEYDLETSHGLRLLREDCKHKAAREARTAAA